MKKMVAGWLVALLCWSAFPWNALAQNFSRSGRFAGEKSSEKGNFSFTTLPDAHKHAFLDNFNDLMEAPNQFQGGDLALAHPEVMDVLFAKVSLLDKSQPPPLDAAVATLIAGTAAYPERVEHIITQLWHAERTTDDPGLIWRAHNAARRLELIASFSAQGVNNYKPLRDRIDADHSSTFAWLFDGNAKPHRQPLGDLSAHLPRGLQALSRRLFSRDLAGMPAESNWKRNKRPFASPVPLPSDVSADQPSVKKNNAAVPIPITRYRAFSQTLFEGFAISAVYHGILSFINLYIPSAWNGWMAIWNVVVDHCFNFIAHLPTAMAEKTFMSSVMAFYSEDIVRAGILGALVLMLGHKLSDKVPVGKRLFISLLGAYVSTLVSIMLEWSAGKSAPGLSLVFLQNVLLNAIFLRSGLVLTMATHFFMGVLGLSAYSYVTNGQFFSGDMSALYHSWYGYGYGSRPIAAVAIVLSAAGFSLCLLSLSRFKLDKNWAHFSILRTGSGVLALFGLLGTLGHMPFPLDSRDPVLFAFSLVATVAMAAFWYGQRMLSVNNQDEM